MTPVKLPPSIGRYEVIDRLGHGGMGVVYRGLDPRIGRQVAIKLLRLDDEVVRERFLQEAQSAGKLAHRNIVTIFDYGEHEGEPFIVMEFIEGITLAEQVRDRIDLPVQRKLEIIEELSLGLDYAHNRGVIHRDVKPANVMINRDGVVKVLDFGIARISTSGLTQTGALMGTPNYMSPEQVEGNPVDRRSDLFSVGLVLYELLSCRQAFTADSPHAVMFRIARNPAPPIGELCPGLPESVIEIVDKSLEKNPDDRYQTLGEMATALAVARGRTGPIVVGLPDGVGGAYNPLSPLPTPKRQTPRSGVDLDALSKLRTTRVEAHLQTARIAFDSGNYSAAAEACEQAALMDPDEPRVLDLLEQSRSALVKQSTPGMAAPAPLAATVIATPMPVAPPPGAAPATEPAKPKSNWMPAAAAAVILTIGAGAWYALRQSQAAPFPPPGPTETKAQNPPTVTVPVPASNPPADVSPTTSVATPPGVEIDRTVRAARIKLEQSDLTGAADAIDDTLRHSEGNATLDALRTEIIAGARKRADAAQRAADQAGIGNLHDYEIGRTQRRSADQSKRGRGLKAIVVDYLSAADSFEKARQQSLANATSAGAATRPATTNAAQPPAPVNPGRSGPAPAPPAAPPVGVGVPVTAPAITPSAPPETPPPATPAGIDAQTRDALVREWAAAYKRLDMAAMAKVYPNISRNLMVTERVKYYKDNRGSCDLRYSNWTEISPQQWNVETTESCRFGTGRPPPDLRSQQSFVFRKDASGKWTIDSIIGA